MQKRMMIGALGALLCVGAIATAQNPWGRITAKTVIKAASGQTTLTGGVVIEVNGVLVKADRAVINDREVALEGNVRLTLPAPK